MITFTVMEFGKNVQKQQQQNYYCNKLFIENELPIISLELPRPLEKPIISLQQQQQPLPTLKQFLIQNLSIIELLHYIKNQQIQQWRKFFIIKSKYSYKPLYYKPNKYTEFDILKALHVLKQQKISLRQTAKQFNIPHSTLYSRFKKITNRYG
jgi:hypothetical protein